MSYHVIYVKFIGNIVSGKGHKNICYGVRGAILSANG